MAGSQPELANEFALRSAIAFTKRMGRIQLAEKIGSSLGERCSIEGSELVFSRKFLQGLRYGGFQEGGESEEMAAFGHVHRPKLSRPLVHVLKDVPMDRLEVRDIEFSGR